MLAVAGGHVDAVSLLLEREASVDMADSQGLTSLHLGVSPLLSLSLFSYLSLFLSLLTARH